MTKNDYPEDIISDKLGIMFEYAVNNEKIDIDKFANIFCTSKISKSFEQNDLVAFIGKSALELLGELLNKTYPPNTLLSQEYSPEYWVGWVYAKASIAMNIPYKALFESYPATRLLNDYNPYHEMDVMHIIDKISLSLSQKQKTARQSLQ